MKYSSTQPAAPVDARFEPLQQQIAGEVRTDPLSRVLYATDASIYEILPDAAVLPKTAADVVATVRFCAAHNIPVTPRGAGTGLTGAAVNRGVQLDFTRYMNKVLHLDVANRTVDVEPGVVLDELNALLKPHGLQFAPDVATSSRATIGGMIAVNSCGAHSILYGRTVDHVDRIDVVLADGSQHAWGPAAPVVANPLAAACDQAVHAVATELQDEIAARYPKVLRSNGGYALDRLRPDDGGGINTETILCGSEGTLAIVTSARLRLIPLPAAKALVLVLFDTLEECFHSVPHLLTHQPAAVELIDDLIMNATAGNAAMARRRWFVRGKPQAVIVCEFFADDEATLRPKLERLVADLQQRGTGRDYQVVTDAHQQADVWEVRKAGLGLLMSKPGERQPYAFVEDTAVDPARLPEYMARFDALLHEEGVTEVGHYAHASVGCLHIRPVLNLRQQADIDRMRRIADRVSTLAHEFGGTMTGEHGDGIVRSGWLEKMYGPRIVAAFKRLKQTFDPQGILNPGKIVDPLPMTEHLRQGAGFQSDDVQTLLDFSAYGGMAGLAGMCTGVGQCRQQLVGTMCPSYIATHDESNTTRARANALRVALSNRGLLDGIADPALDDVMDLCLSCKACKTECPTGTDMTKLKAEWLSHRNERLGVPRRSRAVAASVRMAAWGSHFAPLSNWVMQSKAFRIMLEHLIGFDRRVPPPKFARVTFRQWFSKRPTDAQYAQRPPVVYFVDTWANFYQPQVGQAAVQVLEALGYRVLVPPTVCCGRPLISKGMLRDARKLAEQNVDLLVEYARDGIPIVGTEPSCVSAILDEWPQFVRTNAARDVAGSAQMIETFVARELAEDPHRLRFRDDTPPIIYHGHCHQKSLVGTDDAARILDLCTHGHGTDLDTGCCGMAGAFGHEVEHYDVARAVGEHKLFPAIRARGDAAVAVSGFSCRHHIAHHTGVEALHIIEHLARALA